MTTTNLVRRSAFVALDGSNNGSAPIDLRLAYATTLLVDDGSGALGIRQGIFYDGLGAAVVGTTDTGTMTYQIRACTLAYYLLGTAASGGVVTVIDAATKVNTTAAPGSNSRIDVIWVRQQSVAADGGSDVVNLPLLGCTQGTPAASPSVPAIPTGALDIAHAVVLSSTTQTSTCVITQTHNWTTSHGSPIPVRNSTEQGTLTPFLGMTAYRLDLDAVQRYTGAAWRQENALNPPLGLGHKPRRILVNTTVFFASLSNATNGAASGYTADTGDDGATSGITVAANGLITVTKGGLYHVAAGILFGTAASGSIAIQLWTTPTINGSAVITAGSQVRFAELANSSSVGITVDADWDVVLPDGGTICIGVRQSSGGTLAVGSATAGAQWLTIVRDDDA